MNVPWARQKRRRPIWGAAFTCRGGGLALLAALALLVLVDLVLVAHGMAPLFAKPAADRAPGGFLRQSTAGGDSQVGCLGRESKGHYPQGESGSSRRSYDLYRVWMTQVKEALAARCQLWLSATWKWGPSLGRAHPQPARSCS